MPAIIGGNVLSPFYSSAIFVPYSGATTFTSIASLTGSYWSTPFCRAIPRRHRGLADATHSWYPQTRGVRHTQTTWDCLINVFANPDVMPEAELPLRGIGQSWQMYLTLGNVANYPAVDTNQYYWWCPSVFVEEVPHTINLQQDPAPPIAFDLTVKSNAPAFFLPTDGVGSPSAISTFLSYIIGLSWAF